jgi:hypothetical protein
MHYCVNWRNKPSKIVLFDIIIIPQIQLLNSTKMYFRGIQKFINIVLFPSVYKDFFQYGGGTAQPSSWSRALAAVGGVGLVPTRKYLVPPALPRGRPQPCWGCRRDGSRSRASHLYRSRRCLRSGAHSTCRERCNTFFGITFYPF